ncbi:NAD-dependent epimerase/dehydratase [Macrophomina phaseolina MS6]|uniref:NAD-dependent epimerase/dehydratase n=1 Tax=Macrophomina phaseolina (strain MS6) TaxID=1126212 RepID=K2RIP3_MACPH|nr:NAD-dependent epimerase/dehydratase [Macrophomina phaseolina MS6]
MPRVLLTGASGFLATHILNVLLERGYSVVATVRSHDKAERIRQDHPSYGKDKLDFSLVNDIAKEGAFDEAVKTSPPLDAVIHAASPFHYDVTDVQKQLLDPAVIGTTGILKSIQKGAPTVKKVVITSSFAAILDAYKGNWPEHTYSEQDWNPVTLEQALTGPGFGYMASKTFAEKAAWDFVQQEKPHFTLSTMNPPMVLGPALHHPTSLDALNTSNQTIRDIVLGKHKDSIPDTGMPYLYVDVRDLALGHVKALEVPGASGKRFFFPAGRYRNREIVEIIRNNFPEYRDRLPAANAPGDEDPAGGVYKFDNRRVRDILGIEFMPFEKTIVDTVKSLKALGA